MTNVIPLFKLSAVDAVKSLGKPDDSEIEDMLRMIWKEQGGNITVAKQFRQVIESMGKIESDNFSFDGGYRLALSQVLTLIERFKI